MVACSASFLTPISFQTNLMVMGPGRYEFLDYLRFGAGVYKGSNTFCHWKTLIALHLILLVRTCSYLCSTDLPILTLTCRLGMHRLAAGHDGYNCLACTLFQPGVIVLGKQPTKCAKLAATVDSASRCSMM